MTDAERFADTQAQLDDAALRLAAALDAANAADPDADLPEHLQRDMVALARQVVDRLGLGHGASPRAWVMPAQALRHQHAPTGLPDGPYLRTGGTS